MHLLRPVLLRQLTRGRVGPAARGFVSSAIRSSSELELKGSPTQGLPNQAPLHGADSNAQPIGKDAGPHSRHDIPQPKADKPPNPVTTMEVWPGAAAQLYKDRIVLQSSKLRSTDLSFWYLRDMCKCPQCVDPHSKQRSFRTSDIPSDIRLRHVQWDGQQLKVTWSNDIPGYSEDHTSEWNWKYLWSPVIDTHKITTPDTSPYAWSGPMMNKMQHWVSYEDYMNDDVMFTAAMRNLSRLGLIFVKDVPKSREMVEKIATRMGPLRNTFYGSTWDVKSVPEAKNVAYTNQFLGFHMDLMYMNEPPGYQLLHCIENSCDGGESLFADTFRAAHLLKLLWPEEWEALTKRHMGYEYVHEDSIYYNSRPVFELDRGGPALRYVNYSPPFQSALPLSLKGEKGAARRALFQRALRRFAWSLQRQKSVFQLKLNPGECVIFANRRVVHARNQFNTMSGSRWLAGAYVDEDAVLSRFAVSRKKDPITWEASDPRKDHKKYLQEMKEERKAYRAQLQQAQSSGGEGGERPADSEAKDESSDIESELVGELGKAKAHD